MKLVKKLSKKASKKVTKKATKKATKKTTKKGGAFGTKRPREENMGGPIDRSTMFNDMLNTIGDENVLYDFAEFLGRPDAKIIQCSSNLSNLDCRVFLRESLTDGFCGLIFDGAHWKGYESKEANGTRIIYDSYPTKLQLSGTNNFCQSYATYLWARKGELTYSDHGLEVNFIPEKYTENIQEMAKLWLAWVDNISSVKAGERWLNNSIKQGIKAGDITEGYNVQQLKSTLKEISENDEVARDLSQSKE